MDGAETLSHSQGECKEQVVLIPTGRRRTLHEPWRRPLADGFHQLAPPTESRREEGHWIPDPVHRRILNPPKSAVSPVSGSIKGKSALYRARVSGERKCHVLGPHCWARGDFVSTGGWDDALIRESFRQQAQEAQRLEQLSRWR